MKQLILNSTCYYDKNNITSYLNISPKINSALEEGMKYNLNNFKLIKSKKIKELNQDYLVLLNTESDTYFIININDAFYIDNCKYYSYRIKLKDIFMGSKYEVNKFIDENKNTCFGIYC